MKIKNFVAGGLMVLSGCSIAAKNCYKTMDIDSIINMKPAILKSSEKFEKMFLKNKEFFRKFPDVNFNLNGNYKGMDYKELIKKINNPFQVQDYLNKELKYDEEEKRGISVYLLGSVINFGMKGYTFKYTSKMKKGTCLDYAVSAAALLSDDNYPPLILAMTRKNEKGHAVFLYKADSGYGCLGTTPLPPVFDSVEEVVEKLGNYDYYTIVNLDENFRNREWIDRDIDLQTTIFDKGYFVGKH